MLSIKRNIILKLLPLLFCFMGFYVGSCSENSQTNLNDSSSLQSIDAATQTTIKDMADNYPILYTAHLKHPKLSRKAIYRKLSPNQKYTVWKNRFHDILNNISLTQKQKILLEEVGKRLSPDLFAENADGSDFMNDKTIKKIMNVFGKRLGGDIFVSLKTAQEIKNRK